MTDPRIVVGQPGSGEPRVHRAPGPEWQVLLTVGLLFVVVGGADVALVWYPARFGVPEFEFASVAASLNSLPVVTMGVALLVAASSKLALRKTAWLALVVIVLLGLLVLVGGVLFGLTVPLALQAEVEPTILTGIKKQVAKGVVQLVGYGVTYLLLARWTLKVALAKPA